MNPNDWQSRFLAVMADMTDDEAVSITREAIKSHGVHEAKFLVAFLLACREVGQAYSHGGFHGMD